MKIVEIVASRSVRVNTGNFEGTEHFVSAKAELDELDDPEQSMMELAGIVEERMVVQLQHHYKARAVKNLIELGNIRKHHGLKGKPV